MKSRLKGLLALTLSLVMMLSMVTVGWGAVNGQGVHVCDTADCLVCDVADKINDLPAATDISVNNAAAVTEQIHAIDRVKFDLSDDEYEELLTKVDSANYAPTRYFAAVDAIKALSDGASFYIQKEFLSDNGTVNTSDATVQFKITNVDTSATQTLTLATIPYQMNALSSDADFYSANADGSGWKYKYILPAGTYRIEEISDSGATVNGAPFVTGSTTYNVNGQTTTDYAIVTVENGESSVVSVYNSLPTYTVTFMNGDVVWESPISVSAGNTLRIAGMPVPDAPASAPAGSVFYRWYTQDNVWVYHGMTVTKDLTAYATWRLPLAGTVTITGIPAVGQTLTATAAITTAGVTSLNYQWLRGDQLIPITGATNSTYVPTDEDVNSKLTCMVSSPDAPGTIRGTSDTITATPPAPTTYPVYIGGVQFTSNNLVIDSNDIAGVTGTATYVPADGTNPATLTLNDFTYDGTEIGISADVGLTIVLEGNNTITSTSDCGILVFGNLIINGTDVLTATGNSFGIKADGNISITGGTVTATGSDAIAVYEHNANGTISIKGDNTKVTANGENSGIYAKGSVTISSGEVTAKATENDSWGIYGGNNVTIEDGAKVTANANDDGGVGIGTNYSTNSASSGNSIVISGDNTEVTVGCETGLAASTVKILENSTVSINADNNAINCGTLNMGGNWYQWTADSNPVQISSDSNQLNKNDAATAKFLKIEKVTPVPTTYTISFNANGGTGTMADVVGVSGSYTLPANGFTAPAGKEFKGWDVDGTEYAADATINVTANTTVKAVWQDSGKQGGGYPGIPGGPVPTVTPTTPAEGTTVTTPNTFDGGIALSVAMTILTATGSVVLAKKRED